MIFLFPLPGYTSLSSPNRSFFPPTNTFGVGRVGEVGEVGFVDKGTTTTALVDERGLVRVLLLAVDSGLFDRSGDPGTDFPFEPLAVVDVETGDLDALDFGFGFGLDLVFDFGFTSNSSALMSWSGLPLWFRPFIWDKRVIFRVFFFFGCSSISSEAQFDKRLSELASLSSGGLAVSRVRFRPRGSDAMDGEGESCR
jgi:hypothetical protein